jgi:hypothetical protein
MRARSAVSCDPWPSAQAVAGLRGRLVAPPRGLPSRAKLPLASPSPAHRRRPQGSLRGVRRVPRGPGLRPAGPPLPSAGRPAWLPAWPGLPARARLPARPGLPAWPGLPGVRAAPRPLLRPAAAAPRGARRLVPGAAGGVRAAAAARRPPAPGARRSSALASRGWPAGCRQPQVRSSSSSSEGQRGCSSRAAARASGAASPAARARAHDSAAAARARPAPAGGAGARRRHPSQVRLRGWAGWRRRHAWRELAAHGHTEQPHHQERHQGCQAHFCCARPWRRRAACCQAAGRGACGAGRRTGRCAGRAAALAVLPPVEGHRLCSARHAMLAGEGPPAPEPPAAPRPCR